MGAGDEAKAKSESRSKTHRDKSDGEDSKSNGKKSKKARPNFDQEDDDDDWQKEYNQEAADMDTSNQPPDNHEGKDIERWLATTRRPKWLAKEASQDKQETGEQIRKRIIKQRRYHQARREKEGIKVDEGLLARTRGRSGTTNQGEEGGTVPTPAYRNFYGSNKRYVFWEKTAT